MIDIRMCMVVRIVGGRKAFRLESWKHSVRELASLEQVANMPTCLYFTGYLEVARSDLVEVSCRLSSRRYLKICPCDGKDTSTPSSVSKYRYVSFFGPSWHVCIGWPEYSNYSTQHASRRNLRTHRTDKRGRKVYTWCTPFMGVLYCIHLWSIVSTWMFYIHICVLNICTSLPYAVCHCGANEKITLSWAC